MSKKYLFLLIFVTLISISVVCANENTDDNIISNDDSADLVEKIDDISLANGTDVENNDDSSGNDGNGEDSNDGSQDSEDDEDFDDYEDPIDDDPEDDYDDYEERDLDGYLFSKAVFKASKLKTTYNSGKTFNVKVVSGYDKSFPLGYEKIKLRVYNKNNYKDYYAFTNLNGIAKFKVSTLSLGTHKVKVFMPHSYPSAKTLVSSVKITKAKTKVLAPKITTKYKKSKTFKIKIIDKATKRAVKNVKVSVKIGKKKLILKTTRKGLINFKTKSFKPGKYKVTITSKNSNYIISAKSSIVIKK